MTNDALKAAAFQAECDIDENLDIYGPVEDIRVMIIKAFQPLIDADWQETERLKKALRAFMDRDHVTLVGQARTPCCAYCSIILDNSEHDEECPVVLGGQAFGEEK